MDDLSFLDAHLERGQSNATLKVVLPNGEVREISDRICPFKFLDKCPLLYHAFEYGFQSRLQASLEAPSEYAIISLLRYCYTGSYLPPQAEYGPILLLPHVETYKIAEDFDVPELQLLAHGNIAIQIDFACSLPAPPQDLFETIRFVYRHYASQKARRQHALVGTILNYCISTFLTHKLGQEAEFLKVAADIPDFRQDLCCTNMGRNFEDECALDIVRFSLDTLRTQPCARPTLLASRDLPQEMICGDSTNTPRESYYSHGDHLAATPYKTHEEASQDNMVDSAITTFVHRPKAERRVTFAETNVDLQSMDTHSGRSEDDSTSKLSGTTTSFSAPALFNPAATQSTPDDDALEEDQGFTLVSRPKPHTLATIDEPMSSPEMLPTPVLDILAASGTDYTSDDDDDWDMISTTGM
ncbi:hypothetical protein ACET3X_000616 [Alternaria dauci]|uniref:BTB domain-containing protein n=1 Tax=Alternaria dauci TaxID=48095 RepID=A0ABR3UVB6_9PLEO